MGKVKQIEIKNRTYYFYNDMTNLKNFTSNMLKIDKKHYKGIDIDYIGYVTDKELVIMKIFAVYILCICLLIMQLDILNKNMEIILDF